MKNVTIRLICIMLSLTGNTFAQKKLIKKFLSGTSDTSRRISFIPLPAVAYAQETGLEMGAIFITSFYTSKTDTITRSSAINGIITFTTKSQSNFVLKPDIWTPGNRYHYSGAFRYKNFPFNFYGIGDSTHKADEDPLGQTLLTITAEAEKLIGKSIYAGINAGYENYSYKDKEPGGLYGAEKIYGKEGGRVLYVGLSAIFDSRNTNTYTTKGSYLKLNYSYAPHLMGSGNFTGSLIRADFRQFNELSPETSLGFNINYQTIQGNDLPFYLLPQLGNDQVMRGYYTGRYRDQNLLTAHAELRWHFMTRFGLAGFAGTGSVFRNSEFSLKKLKPNYGAGIRYFLDPARGLTLRMDYAVGEKRPQEARQTGFYLALAEAF